MKNFFGVVPGSVYGWPKNKLHYYGIPESIVALNRQFGRKAFAIVDGVIGMEGNGPIQGTPKPVGVLVMGSDLVAVDSTCCRVMGINPEKVSYLRMAADLGHVHPERIEQRGETIASVQTNFSTDRRFQRPAALGPNAHSRARGGRKRIRACRGKENAGHYGGGIVAAGGTRAPASHPAGAEARHSRRIQLPSGERYIRVWTPGQSHARRWRTISRRCRS